MNILLIIVGLILVWRVAEGFHHGMVKEVIAFVGLFVLAVSIVLFSIALDSYFDKQYINMLIAIIMLLVICIIHRIVSVVFFSAKLVSKLPVVHTFDRMLGGVVGILETLIGVWILFSIILIFDTGIIGDQIILLVKQSKILTLLYEYNYLAKWVMQISNAIVNLQGLPKWKIPEMKLPQVSELMRQ